MPPPQLRGELARLETEIAPVLAEMIAIKAKLAPYEEICDKLAEARKQLRALEEALLERLESARAGFTADQTRELVLDLAREALVRVLSAGVTTHRQQVVAAVENLWDKYRVSLTELEHGRADVVGRLDGMIKELGYT